MQQATREMPIATEAGRGAWRFAFGSLLALAGAVLAFRGTLASLVNVWETQEEYSYGYIVPFVFAFLVYQRLHLLRERSARGRWWALPICAIGMGMIALGRLSTLDTIAQYGLLAVVWSGFLAYLGWPAFRKLLVPMAVLAFMVPIPNYLLRELSASLQLISSALGVQLIRLCGISVYLEGNVIDLGSMKLQVVEACSGLRYLFSLLVLSFLVAYFYRANVWRRLLVFLSAIPVTVLMNSVRIALVGVTVDHFGRQAAEGLLHDFEGVTIFLGCVLILLAEIWLMTVFARPRRAFRDVFALDIPSYDWSRLSRTLHPAGAPVLLWIGALWCAALVALSAPERAHSKPARASFASFPLELAGARGYPGRLEADVQQLLKHDDYLLVNYFDAQGHAINLYASYYAAQSDGNGVHSPRACIPGDGWEIQAFGPHTVSSVRIDSSSLIVNRAVIQKGENRALVYYWFQQRGRFVTGEYQVKLYLLWDSLFKGRTDGAMVRLVAPLDRGEPIETAERRLDAFAQSAMTPLRRFIPE